ncbi:uncharacterized protein [Nicotiana sylvestris]|uniref:uncharacterized protein n=1 Tax=Nicotiana sylvestris TaxID=4096 RepID=UPI00388C7ACC
MDSPVLHRKHDHTYEAKHEDENPMMDVSQGRDGKLVRGLQCGPREHARKTRDAKDKGFPHVGTLGDRVQRAVRGANIVEFRRQCAYMVKFPNPTMLVLLETRMAYHKHLTVELKFDAQFQSPGVGQSGGILLMWKDELVKLEEVATTPQGVHIMAKLDCWGGGDFNELLKARDKFGGDNLNTKRSNKLWICLNSCKLVDLGFKGSKYTWSNKRYTNRHDLILERLDRCFSTDEWIEQFPDSIVTHLLRTQSDHCPLLLSLINRSQNKANKLFKFESLWCNHPDFLPIVQDNFTTNTDILRATTAFTNRVADWNKHVFGNIFHRKRHILARLAGIQKSSGCPFSTFLQDLEVKFQQDFSVILKSKEDFWKLRSKINWLSECNANTKFFHIFTLNRRRRNMIMPLKDEVGNLIQDPQDIKDTNPKLLH